jgi:ribosomal subunit interface protein
VVANAGGPSWHGGHFAPATGTSGRADERIRSVNTDIATPSTDRFGHIVAGPMRASLRLVKPEANSAPETPAPPRDGAAHSRDAPGLRNRKAARRRRAIMTTLSQHPDPTMKSPLQITFLGMQHSDAVEAAVREKVTKLEQVSRDIVSCRVDVELPQKHQSQGRLFSVRVHLTVPGHELNVDRAANEDVYVAVRDAFDDMKRQLDELDRYQPR